VRECLQAVCTAASAHEQGSFASLDIQALKAPGRIINHVDTLQVFSFTSINIVSFVLAR
jgi:hypothetical protein